MFGPSPPGQRQRLLGAPPVLLERLALPGEDRDARGSLGRAVGADGDRGGGVVLGGEDVAGGPAHLGAERDERLDQHRGLDRHVQRAGDRARPSAAARRRTPRAIAIRPGISCSARRISLRPNSASERSATLKSAWSAWRWWSSCPLVGDVGQVSWAAAASRRSCLSCSKRSQSRAGTSAGARARPRATPSTAARSSASARRRRAKPISARPTSWSLEQLAQGAQALELGARRRGGSRTSERGRLDEADALDVAQHARRPAGGLRGLVDGQRVHGGRTLPRLCQGSASKTLPMGGGFLPCV